MKCGKHKGVAYREITLRNGNTKFGCPSCHAEVTGQFKAIASKAKGAAKEDANGDHDQD